MIRLYQIRGYNLLPDGSIKRTGVLLQLTDPLLITEKEDDAAVFYTKEEAKEAMKNIPLLMGSLHFAICQSYSFT